MTLTLRFRLTRGLFSFLRSIRAWVMMLALVGATLVALAVVRRPDAMSLRVGFRGDGALPQAMAQSAPGTVDGLASWIPQGSQLTLAQVATLAADVYAAPSAKSVTTLLLKTGKQLNRRTELSTRVCCADLRTHLVADVWTVTDTGTSPRAIDEVVLVFRGTVNTSAERESSWCSNLRELPLPFCHEHEDQHRAVPPFAARALVALRHELAQGARLTLVGHSLGASLALSALPELLPDLVVAFNGSFAETSDLFGPIAQARVEGMLQTYSGVALDRMNSRGNPNNGSRLRDSTLAGIPDEDWQWQLSRKPGPYATLWVTEQGEVLADVQRLLAVPLLAWRAREKAAHRQRPRVDLDLNVLDGDPVSQHGISALACRLLRLPAECGPDQRFTAAFERAAP